MLANPRWDDLLIWLRQQPADTPYEYRCSNGCLAAQFNRAHDREYNVPPKPFDYSKTGDFDTDMEQIAYCKQNATVVDRTFGEALKRAEEWA